MNPGSKRTNARKRPVNRRRANARVHRLDVQVGRRIENARRNQWILTVLSKLVILVTLIGSLGYGAYSLAHRLFLSNPDYQISSVEIEVDGSLTLERIRGIANIQEGSNILSVNLEKIRENVESLSQVQLAEVERKFPGTISIRVRERKPVAWVTTSLEVDPYTSPWSFLVDARGVAIKPDQIIPDFLRLPVITGLNPELLFVGQMIDSVELRAALDLIRLRTSSVSPLRFDIRSIDLGKQYCMFVKDSQHREYVFPLEHLERKLLELEAILMKAETMGEVQKVNLMMTRNMSVTFKPLEDFEQNQESETSEKESSAKPAATPKPKRASKPRAASQGSRTQVPTVRRAIPVEKAPRAIPVNP